MHPTVRQYLMTAMVADLHRQARRDALASQARRARAEHRGRAVSGRAAGLVTRALAGLNAASRAA